MTAVDPRPSGPMAPASGVAPVASHRRRRGAAASVRAYVSLTKPRVVELLLVTTVPTMVLAARGLPPLGLVLATLAGGAAAAGGAHALNQVLERDIDAVMDRTARRPLATGEVSPRAAAVFATALLMLAATVLVAWVNVLAALLTLAAAAFYVLGYTVLLKRRTPQNIVWGGAAGCVPTLVGWAAVTGRLAWAPVVLFLVVFLWTPPHYWPLAMRFRDDYARAGVPMLPVVTEPIVVARRIAAYTWATVAVSLLLWPVAGTGWLYPAVALAAGAWFLAEAHRLLARAAAGRTGAALHPMRLFHGSISYLALLFAAVALDPLLFR